MEEEKEEFLLTSKKKYKNAQQTHKFSFHPLTIKNESMSKRKRKREREKNNHAKKSFKRLKVNFHSLPFIYTRRYDDDDEHERVR